MKISVAYYEDYGELVDDNGIIVIEGKGLEAWNAVLDVLKKFDSRLDYNSYASNEAPLPPE